MNDLPETGFRIGPAADPDRYVLGAAVSSGAEGILYRGSITTPTGFELAVAIKMLQPRFLNRVDEWHARWSEQVELLRSLQVPGVVRVRDGFVGPLPHAAGERGEGRTLYLVMNWVEGEPLDEWVRRHPSADPFQVLKMLLGVAVALDLMHSGRPTGGRPVVHRDVKPNNVLVTDEGALLVDFGLTRGLPTGHRLSGVVGTPGYIAPEAADAGLYTPGSDRYAFGALVYFVFTGHDPPTGHEPESLRTSLAAVPALTGRPAAVNQIMAMLDANPAARPDSLANWVGQLRGSSLSGLPEVLAPQAPHRNPGSASGQMAPSASRQLRRRVPVIAALVAVFGLLCVAAVSGRNPRPEAAAVQIAGEWQAVDPGPLATRGEAAAVWTGKEVLVVGGLAVEQYRAFSDGAAFDPSTRTWRPIPPRPVPGRVIHAVWTGDELVTFGTDGISVDKLTTASAYSPASNQWRSVPLPPSAERPTDVVWTGSQIIVWQPEGISPGALWDPAADSWTAIAASSLPGVVSYGRAIWIGDELAIQGGVSPAHGGPVEQRLFFLNPVTHTWRVSSAMPGSLMPWLFIPPVWTGLEILFSAQSTPTAMKTYLYNPKSDQWREIANPGTREGSGFSEGVRLDDGRVVIYSGEPNNPFHVLDVKSGNWVRSGPAPGLLPGGPLVSTGRSVFLWGVASKDHFVQTRSPNASWLWSP